MSAHAGMQVETRICLQQMAGHAQRTDVLCNLISPLAM